MSTMTAPRFDRVPALRAAPTGSHVRLTRRGQWVALMLLAAMAFTVLSLIGPRSSAVPGNARLEPVQTIQVQPGQTLWDIARQVAPDQDPRAVVDAIVDLNALTDPGTLQVGQRLGVPDFS
jgi:nucleoid-associated protein YgaU